jgi:hypothetical protein
MTSASSHPEAGVINRRSLLKYGAAAGAAAAIGPAVSAPAGAAHTRDAPRVLPLPTPIPGGLQIPGLPLLHVFAPGPPEVTLPFSGTQLQGLDVEPSVITNYTGTTAVAFHVGSAVGSDGARYNLETDMRAIQGTYIAADGSRRHGTFGFI